MMIYKTPLAAVVLVFVLSACTMPTTATESLSVNRELSNSYTLTDNYNKHRSQQKTVTTSAGDIAYLDVGHGPVLVLLHGVPTSSWLYRKMIPGLQKNFRVIAIDLLGYGSSSKPKSSNGNYLPASQASYIQQLLSELKVANYNLLFHDMGGLVAWELLDNDLAASAPAIENLIVLNTIISEQGFKHPGAKKGVISRMMANAYSNKLSSAAVVEMTFKNMGLTNNARLSASECKGYVTPMREGASDALYDFFTGFDETQFNRLDTQIAGLTRFNGDALIMWGKEDEVLTAGQIPSLTSVLDIKEENIVIYSDHAHFLPEEIPDDLVSRINAFLAK